MEAAERPQREAHRSGCRCAPSTLTQTRARGASHCSVCDEMSHSGSRRDSQSPSQGSQNSSGGSSTSERGGPTLSDDGVEGEENSFSGGSGSPPAPFMSCSPDGSGSGSGSDSSGSGSGSDSSGSASSGSSGSGGSGDSPDAAAWGRHVSPLPDVSSDELEDATALMAAEEELAQLNRSIIDIDKLRCDSDLSGGILPAVSPPRPDQRRLLHPHPHPRAHPSVQHAHAHSHGQQHEHHCHHQQQQSQQQH